MARVTVEDCIEKIPNRFELVMIAAQRARKIGSGAPLTIDRDNDKNPVVSLREVAGQTVSAEALKEEIISSHQRFLPQEDEEETIDLMHGEKEWAEIAAAAGSPRRYDDSNDFSSEEEIDDLDEDDSEPDLEDIAGN